MLGNSQSRAAKLDPLLAQNW